MRKRSDSYTAAELITVMAVAMILMGLVMVAARSVYRRAQIARARAMVVRLEMALAMYEADWGVYPPSAEGAQGNNGTPGTQHNGNSAASLGYYTTSGQDQDLIPNLVQALTSRTERGGPYIEFKAGDLVYAWRDGTRLELSSDNVRYHLLPIVVDPWRQAYVYVCRKYYDPNSATWKFAGDLNDDGNLGDETWSPGPSGTTKGPFHPNYEPDNTNTAGINESCEALEVNTYNLYSPGPDSFTYRGNYFRDEYDPDAGEVYDPGQMTYLWDYSALYDDYQDGNDPGDSKRKFPTSDDVDLSYCEDDIASWW